MFLYDSIPINETRALKVTMVNKLHVDSLDLVDGLNNSHWSVKVFAFHCIVAPHDNLIGSVVGMSKDQVNQHNLIVKHDGEQGKKLHDKF
jgi:hypothetical protein